MNLDDNYGFAEYLHNMFEAEIYANADKKLFAKHLNNLFDENGHIGSFKVYSPYLGKLTQQSLLDLKTYVNNVNNYDQIINSFQNM